MEKIQTTTDVQSVDEALVALVSVGRSEGARALSDAVAVLLGEGHGTFSTGQNYLVEDFVYYVALGDHLGLGFPAMSSFAREHPLAVPPPADCQCLVFLFRDRDLLVVVGQVPRIPRWSYSRLQTDDGLDSVWRIGSLDGVPCFAGRCKGAEIPPALAACDLRELFPVLDEDHRRIAELAIHLLHWERTGTYCGVCGERTEFARSEFARHCAACGHLNYPRIAPSIIVAITRGDEILLARGRRFTRPMFSVLAGFVEAGETLEDCVHREVREEVGIEVTDLRYFGSQPWPFPDSLMIAFTARYLAGEITPDPGEIVEARWYRRDALPMLPGHYSIARKLIDWFVEST